jgi:hypothetical protein
VHNRAVSEKRAPDESEDIDAAIAESFSHAMAAAEAAHDAARMALEMLRRLAELVEERSLAQVRPDGGGDLPAEDGRVPALPEDVLELASLDARAAGVDVASYLRAAVLAYRGDGNRDGNRDGDGAEPARLAEPEAVRREARRVRAESRAVQAQSAQVSARMAEREAARAAKDGASRPPKT